ncbi:MAG TPA: hypothetical protein VGO57_02185 [Verrucomicrobiae bacterium]|jgi:hypothetical protein
MKNKNYLESPYLIILRTLVLALLMALVLPAVADSFNATNILNNGIVIVTDPTNSAGIQTGGIISIPNQDKLGVYLTGYNATANACAVTAKFIRSGKDSTPVINANQRDLESTPIVSVTFTTPATVGPFYCYTNLDSYNIGSAQYIGLAALTNGTASGSITNAEIGVTKKILPIRYP